MPVHSRRIVGPLARGMWLLGATLTLGMVLALPILADVIRPPDSVARLAMSIVFISVVAFTEMSWIRSGGSVLAPFSLFVLASATFNGGTALLLVLGDGSAGQLVAQLGSGPYLTSLYAVTLATAGLGVGAAAAGTTARRFIRRVPELRFNEEDQRAAAMAVGLALMLVAAVPAMLQLRTDATTVLSRGYIGLYQDVGGATDLASITSFLSGLLVPGTLFLLASARNSRWRQWLASGVVVAYAAAQMFFGARFAALASLLAYAAVWETAIRPVSRGWLLGGALAANTLIPAVRAFRLIAGAARSDLAFLWGVAVAAAGSFTAALAEMGGSQSVNAYVMGLVPSTRPFELGLGYLYAMRFIGPNSLWAWQPEYATYSLWLVHQVAPITAAAGGGIGFSFIAEAYMNFGWIGVLAIPILVGAAIVTWMNPRADGQVGVLRAAIVGVVLSLMLAWARGEVVTLTRSFIWYALAPGAACWWLARRHGKARERADVGD